MSDDAVDVVAIRRDLHAHPELAFAEKRTTAADRRHAASGRARRRRCCPAGTGVVCDIGTGDGPLIALRADIDALPIADQKDVPYRSTVDGVLPRLRPRRAHRDPARRRRASWPQRELPGRVRLIFQPAEETVPGGALAVIAAGVLDGVAQIFALHCDPRLDDRRRSGCASGRSPPPATRSTSRSPGPGGHTARPHLTADLVYALGLVITELPGLLSRRVDPRAGVSLVWGAVEAGRAANAIPMRGTLRGTVRVLDRDAWDARRAAGRASWSPQIVAPTGVRGRRRLRPRRAAGGQRRRRGRRAARGRARRARARRAGRHRAEHGRRGLRLVPRAGARARWPGSACAAPGGAAFDLHQGTFDIDEDALAVGVRYTRRAGARRALAAVARLTPDGYSPSERQGAARSSATYSSGAPAACGRLGDQARGSAPTAARPRTPSST